MQDLNQNTIFLTYSEFLPFDMQQQFEGLRIQIMEANDNASFKNKSFARHDRISNGKVVTTFFVLIEHTSSPKFLKSKSIIEGKKRFSCCLHRQKIETQLPRKIRSGRC